MSLPRPPRLLFAAALLTTATCAQAASGTWTQTTTGGLWSDIANWSSGAGPIADGSTFTADFSTIDITADNTVHLDSARTLSNLTFGDTAVATAAGWILDNNGNAANTLTLGTASTITVNALGTGKNATISAVLTGSNGFTKAGAGTLVLSGVNTYTGGTTLSVGSMIVNGDQSSATGAWNLSAAAGATSATFNTGSTIVTSGISLAANTNGNSLNANGTVTNNGSLSISRSGAVNVAGVWNQGGTVSIFQTSNTSQSSSLNINSGGVFTYTGTSTIALNGNNLQGGQAKLTINGGTFVTGQAFKNNTGNGVGAAVITLQNAGTLKITADVGTLLTTTGTSPTAFVLNAGGGKIDTNGDASPLGHTATISQGITGVGSLTKQGLGALTLSGANTYTGGTTVSAGTLAVANGGSIKVGAAGVALTASGATLTVNGTLVLTAPSSTITTVAGTTVDGTTGVIDLGGQFNGFNGGSSGSYNLISGGGTIGGTFSVLNTGYDTNIWSNVTYSNGVLSFTAVPEPSTYGLMGAGALAAVAFVRRRRKCAIAG